MGDDGDSKGRTRKPVDQTVRNMLASHLFSHDNTGLTIFPSLFLAIYFFGVPDIWKKGCLQKTEDFLFMI